MKRASKGKMLISIDTPENFELLGDALSALSDCRGVTKSAICQTALMDSVLPKDPVVNGWIRLYREGKLTALGLMAAFLRRAGEDVERGLPRLNCGCVVDRIIDYVVRYCPKRPYVLPGGMWVREVLSLYRSEWKWRQHGAGGFFLFAELLEDQDTMPNFESFYSPVKEESFVYDLVLDMDAVIAEWNDPALVKAAKTKPLEIAIGGEGDVLVVPYPTDYRILNVMDASSSTHAFAIRFEAEVVPDAPVFLFFASVACFPSEDFTDFDLLRRAREGGPCRLLGKDSIRRFVQAAAEVCPVSGRETDRDVRIDVKSEEIHVGGSYAYSKSMTLYVIGGEDDDVLFPFRRSDGLRAPYILRAGQGV